MMQAGYVGGEGGVLVRMGGGLECRRGWGACIHKYGTYIGKQVAHYYWPVEPAAGAAWLAARSRQLLKSLAGGGGLLTPIRQKT